jgi:hypothetical protein
MNNIPFGILVFYAFLKNLFELKKIEWGKIFLWIWFISGFVIISLFTTKIETYLMPFLIPACLLITLYFFQEKARNPREVFAITMLFLINLFWYLTPSVRNEIKSYLFSGSGAIVFIAGIVLLGIGVVFIAKSYSNKINFRKTYTYVVVIFFLAANIYYLFNISMFEDGFKLAEIKKLSDESGRNKLIYVSSEYEMNPQFSYYFGGIDLGSKGDYDYRLIDLNDGLDKTKNEIQNLEDGKYIILLERDNINAGETFDANLFIPGGITLVKKTHGYEMYIN